MSRDRFAILYKNKFFERTTLSVYALISRAKGWLEVAFWYGLLLLFVVFTLRNLSEVIMYYLSKPTATVARVLPGTSNATIPNFGLHVHMFMTELKAPQLRKVALIEDDLVYPHRYHCMALATESTDISSGQQKNQDQSYYPQIKHQIQENTTKPKNGSNRLNKERWKEWSTNLKQIHGPNLDGAISDYVLLRSSDTLSVQRRLNFWSDAIEKVNMATKAIKHSDWEFLGDALRTMHIIKQGGNAVNGSMNINDLMENVTDSLPLFVEPNDRKWEISIGDWHEQAQGKRQEMVFVVTASEASQYVRLDIYSARMVTQLVYLNALQMYIINVFRLKTKSVKHHRNIFRQALDICAANFKEQIDAAYLKLMEEYRSVWFELILPGTMLPLTTLSINTIILNPTTRIISYASDCHKTTIHNCIDQCQFGRHKESCSCYPWWLSYLATTASTPTCDKYCGDWHEECVVTCEAKGAHCDQTLFSYFSTRRQIDHNVEYGMTGSDYTKEILAYQPLATVLINITKAMMHPVYAEHYAITPNQFVSQIGAVWEFWLGANIFALTHLFVYIIRNIHHVSNSQNRKGKVRSSGKPGVLQNNLDKLKIQLVKLKENYTNSSEQSWWLSNEFYDTTALSGFSFINSAKGKSEKIFWYIFISFCAIWALLNVKEVFAKYHTSPTITHMHVSTENSENSTYGNISLGVESSLFEHSADPLYFLGGLFEHVAHVCHETENAFLYPNLPTHYSFENLANAILYPWKYTRELSVYDQFVENMADELNQNFASTWQQHYTQMSEFIDGELENYWSQNYYFSNTSYSDETVTELFFDDAIHASGKYIWKCMFGALIILRAMELGQDPKVLAIKETSNTKERNVSASAQVLADHAVPVKQLVAAVNLHIRRQTKVSSGQVYLKGWSHDPYKLTQYSFIQVSFPTVEAEVHMDVYSLNLARHLKLMQSISDKFVNYSSETKCKVKCFGNCQTLVPCAKVLRCFGGGDLGRAIAVHRMSHMGLFESLINHYRSMAATVFVAGLHIPLEPFATNYLELQPTVRYKSELEGCYDGHLEECLDECAIEDHMKYCGCVPWYLLHAAKEQIFCTAPCTRALEMKSSCEKKCEEIISHSCAATIYQVQVTTTPLNNYHWPPGKHRPTVNAHLPIFAVQIKTKAASIHPLFMEHYEMSLQDLAGQLGGLLEFFLGVNIIAIIHLAVYLLKKIPIS